MRLSILVLALVATAGFSTVSTAQVGDTTAVLRPGDVVKISVWRKPELSGEFSISASGAIADPFYSEVMVTGVPLAVAAQRIEQYVARIEASPRVWVEPLFRVMVGGEVRTPNLYSLSRETTVAQAIALAGGPTDTGRLDRVTLVRGGQSHLVDLTDPTGEWAAAPIRSGDQIRIGRRTNVFRDVVVPAGSMVAAVGTLVNLFLR